METQILRARLQSLPEKTGVYLFKDETGKIIYIGKAKSLRNRVRSYFQSSRQLDAKTEVLKQHIRDLEYITTDNEVEALILESTLAKRHKPRFNVNLKDDKAFLNIKLTVQEPYPRVLLTRRVLDDGALYFGPYLPASLARNTVKIINRHFLLRTCDLEINGKLERPCLEYHIRRCLGPCVAGLCTAEEYQKAVRDVVLLLEGKNEQLIDSLTAKMKEASAKQMYEAAAFYRDRIQMVKDLAEKQKMVMSGVDDVDVFAYHRQGPRVALQLFTLRNGQVVGRREFFWEDLEFFNPAQFLRDALQQYYLTAGFIPHEVYLPVEIEDQDLISEWLTRKSASRRTVHLLSPKRGQKHNLLLLVEENAKASFENRFLLQRPARQAVLERLQKELGLPEAPRRIEAFDISNIQGAESVASMVVCEEGAMKRSEYRKFRIRTVRGADDFASMFEVVNRRYKRILEEGQRFPDLILIDGGKGQLHSAYQALQGLGVEDANLASIAKREEVIFIQGQDEPLILESDSPVLHLVQEIRDEAHRFAVQYHRKRRSLRDFDSALDQIPGIGEKRKKRLLRNFGSITGVRQASVEELIPFVGEKLARVIKAKLEAADS
ncbi:MAG: excinuclease ABC subunit UvrC [Acidobacteria bacterium]|nr:MAG: excinuclease ABC subunit UvrC [Acidobacteriota bacterium]